MKRIKNTWIQFKMSWKQWRHLVDICLKLLASFSKILKSKFFSDETDENVIENFRLLYKIWKLCEIVFIKSSSSNYFIQFKIQCQLLFLRCNQALAIDLQEWYKITYNLDPIVQKLFKDRENPQDIFSDEDYWPTVNHDI